MEATIEYLGSGPFSHQQLYPSSIESRYRRWWTEILQLPDLANEEMCGQRPDRESEQDGWIRAGDETN